MYKLAADELRDDIAGGTLSPAVRATAETRVKNHAAVIARYDSEPHPADPTRGEGKKELMAKAQRHKAAERDGNFAWAEILLQIALVLGSVAILGINRVILGLSAVLGLAGLLLTVNGYVLLVPLG